MLTRVAARRRFEQRCLAVQFGFVDNSKRNMVLAQKILSLNAGKAQHFRNLVKGQSALAVALKGNGFERSAGHIAAGSRKPLGDVVGDVQRNFHALSLARERRSAAAVEIVNSLAFFFQVLKAVPQRGPASFEWR